MTKNSRVFISYSHDNAEHKRWVLRLACKLGSDGIDIRLDQWHLKPGDDMARFMREEMMNADFKIAICSETYVKKVESGTGGVGYETMIFNAELLKNASENNIIPIVRNSNGKGISLPIFLSSKFALDFSDDEKFVQNYASLLDQLLTPDSNEDSLRPDLNLSDHEMSKIQRTTSDPIDSMVESQTSMSKFGFIAMQYGEKVLENLVRDHIKPKIQSELGYTIIDMRDLSKAGVIDNLMREQIQKSAFVIADLTHDNSGAYWEVGYAEGLGIPVIYICDNVKFETIKINFDTNHCTIICWTHGEEPEFCDNLIATIRRIMNISN